MPPRSPAFHDSMKTKDQYRVPLPKNIKEVPKYIATLVKVISERLFYIVKLVWEASPVILFVMVFMAVFNGVMPIVGSLISKNLLNYLADYYGGIDAATAMIITVLVVQFGYMFLNHLVSRISNLIYRLSGEVVSNHVKLKIMEKAKDIDIASFDDPEFYSKMENANREAGRRPIDVLSSFFSVVSAVISIAGYVVILFGIDAWAPLLVVLASVPSTIINFVYRRKNVDYMFFRSKDRRMMNYFSDVNVDKDLIKEVRMFGLADDFRDRYQNVFQHYYAGLKKLIVGESLWSLGATVVTMAVNCFLFIKIAYGSGAVGDYSLYTGALNSVVSGAGTIINTTASIYESTLFINNMIAFMNQKKNIDAIISPARVPERGTAHSFVFDHVCFRYPGSDHDVLHDICLEINSGESIVLVGLNGAGKTTLIKLLTRLYDPTAGTIYLDGHDIREYDIDKLYKIFGAIFQDFGKYAVNVRENIMFGDIDGEMTDERIENAAHESNADTFIARLTDGYDTPLMRYFEENGKELSIGQWQKLAIARAFYGDSDVLILDEPTASLDPMAEQEIFNQFDSLRSGKTTIFVSHRLSSATTADKIVVLGGGKILEVGSHAELMKKGGEYYTLFSTQARRYTENAFYIDGHDREEAEEHGGDPHGDHHGPHGDPHGGRIPEVSARNSR